MSMLVEPGTQLAGRYRLHERVSEMSGSTLWKAVDEPLARPVAVRTFTADFADLGNVIAAARAASRVPDSRLAQVFDADDRAEQPYMVCEWIDGQSLRDMLAAGPLEPQRAVNVIREATDALVAAHGAGLAHLRLDPTSLMWAKGGTVKITGLAIDAALHGLTLDSSAPVADAQALGMLLCAAATGYWAGDANVGLPPAPRSEDGWPQPAAELHPDLPASLAALIDRTLGRDAGHDSQQLDSPAAFRDALAELPRLAAMPSGPVFGRAQPSTGTLASTPARERPQPRPHSPARPERRPARTLLLSAVVLLVMTATALGAWTVGRSLGNDGKPAAGPTAGTGGGQTPQAVDVSGINDYDPHADGKAHPDEVRYAIDAKPGTAWTTQTYQSAAFGGLKPGLGLMLDMGRPTAVGDVRVRLGGQGSSLELYAGQKPDKTAMSKVASAPNAGGTAGLDPARPVKSRYLLVWFTKLPQVSDGFRAEVSEIVVHAAS